MSDPIDVRYGIDIRNPVRVSKLHVLLNDRANLATLDKPEIRIGRIIIKVIQPYK